MEMTGNSFRFGLDTIDHAIVSALWNALENVMPDIMADNNLQERDGYGQFRWNVIIAQLRERCQHLGWLDLAILTRKAWKTPVLFHPASQYIFTFMTEKTFADVQHRKDKGKHYLSGAASFNHNLPKRMQQVKMEDIHSDFPTVEHSTEKWVMKSREQLASAVKLEVGEIRGHILVLFDVYSDKLLTVRAVRLTDDLLISGEEEDWSKYIQMPFETSQTVELQQNDDDEGETFVELL